MGNKGNHIIGRVLKAESKTLWIFLNELLGSKLKVRASYPGTRYRSQSPGHEAFLLRPWAV